MAVLVRLPFLVVFAFVVVCVFLFSGLGNQVGSRPKIWWCFSGRCCRDFFEQCPPSRYLSSSRDLRRFQLGGTKVFVSLFLPKRWARSHSLLFPTDWTPKVLIVELLTTVAQVEPGYDRDSFPLHLTRLIESTLDQTCCSTQSCSTC